MKKQHIYVFFVLLAATGAAYFYFNNPFKRIPLTPDEKFDIEVFFNFAKEQLPITEEKISSYRTTEHVPDEPNLFELEDKRNLYKTVTAIASGDITTLQSMSKDELEFKDGQVWVPGEKFKNQFDGRLLSRILGAKNALFFVIYHALLNTSETDKQQTLAMLKVLLEKGLTPNTLCGLVFFVKDNPDDTNAPDFVDVMTLYEATDRYFPAAHDLLKQFGMVKSKKQDFGYLDIKNV